MRILVNKVFITSYSVISALGIGNEETLIALENNKQSIYYPKENEKFKKPYFPVTRDLGIKEDITLCSKIVRKLLSLTEEKWLKLAPIPLFIGTSTGGIKETEEAYTKLINMKKKKHNISDKQYFYDFNYSINKKYGDKISDLYTFSTACSASGHSIFHAFRFIKNGIIDKAIVIGTDALGITPMFGFDSLKLISSLGTNPLSKNRDGLSLGEGGAILLLESNPSVDPVAEIIGVSSNSDGYHITSPNPEGTQQRECILNSLKQAEINKEEIDYINAHGTGTPTNDEIEINVIKSIFSSRVIITSLKGFIGHTVGSSAVIELVICLEMLKHKTIFQPLNFTDPIDPEYIPEKTIEKEVKYFIKNSFGFGGNNVSMAIKNYF